jgi:hypothetical protein
LSDFSSLIFRFLLHNSQAFDSILQFILPQKIR